MKDWLLYYYLLQPFLIWGLGLEWFSLKTPMRQILLSFAFFFLNNLVLLTIFFLFVNYIPIPKFYLMSFLLFVYFILYEFCLSPSFINQDKLKHYWLKVTHVRLEVSYLVFHSFNLLPLLIIGFLFQKFSYVHDYVQDIYLLVYMFVSSLIVLLLFWPFHSYTALKKQRSFLKNVNYLLLVIAAINLAIIVLLH